MIGTALEVDDLAVSVSINGMTEVTLSQVRPAVITVTVEGSDVQKAYADEGLELVSEGGALHLWYSPAMEITSICDRKELSKKLRARQEENDAMAIHTRGL
jgi:hypothetical protein